MNMTIAIVAPLLLSLTTQTPAGPKSLQAFELSGDIFIATKGGTSYKLGLVTVRAIPAELVMEHLTRKAPESDAAVSRLQPEIEGLTTQQSAAHAEQKRLHQIFVDDVLNPAKTAAWGDALKKESQIDERLRELTRKMEEFTSDKFLYDGLPAGISTDKTDADGRFTLQIPRQGKFVIAASSSRRIGDTTEKYYWLVRVDAQAPPRRLMLSNDNLMGEGSPESAWK